MKIDARALFVPLVALAVLVLTIQQTIGALKDSGSWKQPTHTHTVTPEDPYTRIDNMLGAPASRVATEFVRNPFVFGAGRSAASITGTGPAKLVKPTLAVTPPAAPKPTLTSIVWDSDPRATVRYDGKEFSVRANSLFADFSVRSITATQVVLDHNGESIVLSLRSKGD